MKARSNHHLAEFEINCQNTNENEVYNKSKNSLNIDNLKLEKRGISSDSFKIIYSQNLSSKSNIDNQNLDSTDSLIAQSQNNIKNINLFSINLSQSNNRSCFSLSPSNKLYKLLPPQEPKFYNKKTLILDLDETLVHSGFTQYNSNIPSDLILKVELDNRIKDIHVLIRPGVDEFLNRMSKKFEIVIFTASLSKYANPLIDILDKNHVCSYRLFREHCVFYNGAFIKDLKRIDRDLKNVILLDNSPVAFVLHPENGLPIKTWYDDKKDRELYKISPIIEFLSYVDDIRNYIPRLIVDNEISLGKAMSIISEYNERLKEKQQSNHQNKNISNKILNINNSYITPKNSNNINDQSSYSTNKKNEVNINITNNNFSNYIYSNNMPPKNLNINNIINNIKYNPCKSKNSINIINQINRTNNGKRNSLNNNFINTTIKNKSNTSCVSTITNNLTNNTINSNLTNNNTNIINITNNSSNTTNPHNKFRKNSKNNDNSNIIIQHIDSTKNFISSNNKIADSYKNFMKGNQNKLMLINNRSKDKKYKIKDNDISNYYTNDETIESKNKKQKVSISKKMPNKIQKNYESKNNENNNINININNYYSNNISYPLKEKSINKRPSSAHLRVNNINHNHNLKVSNKNKSKLKKENFNYFKSTKNVYINKNNILKRSNSMNKISNININQNYYTNQINKNDEYHFYSNYYTNNQQNNIAYLSSKKHSNHSHSNHDLPKAHKRNNSYDSYKRNPNPNISNNSSNNLIHKKRKNTKKKLFDEISKFNKTNLEFNNKNNQSFKRLHSKNRTKILDKNNTNIDELIFSNKIPHPITSRFVINNN